VASNRSRSTNSVGNKLNNLDSRVARNEKGTNNPHLSPDVIEGAHIKNASIEAAKLADRAITENKIARGAVGTEHLGIVNTITADSGLTLKPGPDGGFIVIDGAEYVAPTAGSGSLFVLGFNELKQVVVSSSSIGGGDGVAPAGSIMAWASNTIPANWLLCDGSVRLRADYASLFAAIGTQYNTGGETSLQFRLPDLRGRVPVGADRGIGRLTTNNALGQSAGFETHTLTEAQLPSHNHTMAHTHTFSGTTSENGVHNHAQRFTLNGAPGSTMGAMASSGSAQAPGITSQQITVDAGAHTHTYSGTSSASSAANTGNAGSGSAHNNLQPYQVVNYIIKFSAGETAGDSELATRVGALETTVRGVPLGGTGASTLTSGGYLKGNGTSAITSQTGIPAGDITSGSLSRSRLPSGAILQIAESARTSSVTVSGQYSYADTGLTVTITPTSASSRFRLTGNLIASCSAAGWVFMRFMRGSTVIGNGTIGTAVNYNSVTYIGDFGRVEPLNGSFIDSPATTSAIVYKIQFAVFTGTGILNRRSADLLFGGYSNLIVEEIA